MDLISLAALSSTDAFHGRASRIVGGLLFSLLLAFAPATATPTTASLPATADTTIRVLQPNQNRGSEDLLRVGWVQGSRVLVQFDAQAIRSQVGTGRLTSAKLELWIEDSADLWLTSPQILTVHRVLVPWSESGATWNCAVDTNLSNATRDCVAAWNGGDVATTPSDQISQTSSLRGKVRFDVTADVSTLLSGSTFHGWLIKKANQTLSGRVDYAARERADLSHRPALVLTVEPAAPDITAPQVGFTAPANGSFLASARPTLQATFSDAQSGVDLSSVRLTIDGFDRTANATTTATGLQATPTTPLGEGPHSAKIAVRDRAGNASEASISFTTDTVAPTVLLLEPVLTVLGEPTPSVRVAFSDATSGIDLGRLSIVLDSFDLTVSCEVSADTALCLPPALADGPHAVVTNIFDRAGNRTVVSRTFEVRIDRELPAITLVQPPENLATSLPSVRVVGTVTDDLEVASVAVQGINVPLAAGRFEVDVPLEAGVNAVVVTATDGAGKTSFLSRAVRLDQTPPTLVVESPRADEVVNSQTLRVAGRATDDSGEPSVSVQGLQTPLSNDEFEMTVPLLPGIQSVTIRALDRAGNASSNVLTVRRFDLPEVTIISPPDLSILAATTIAVSGTVGASAVSVIVNGITASLSGGAFSVAGVPLVEGGNLVTATVRDTEGHVSTATIQVVRDLEPPHVAVESPRDSLVTEAATIDVSGLVNDLVPGTVNAGQAVVRVNGRPAAVSNRSFFAKDIPLGLGPNVLAVIATDASGNSATTSVSLVRVAPNARNTPRIALISGDRQTAVIGTTLSEPLVVALRDAAGLPVAGKDVIFKLVASDGTLDGHRKVAAVSNAAGLASVHWTLGTRAGLGNQRVEASSPGFDGPVIFRVEALAGPPANLLVDSGDQQVGTAGRGLPRPLIAVVTDAGFNRLPDEPVRFQVAKGAGHFRDGTQSLLALSDSDGRVIVPFVLDDAEGIANNIVEARLEGIEASPLASFVATGRAGAEPAATSVSGLVLDNASRPIAGVTARLRGSALTATTNTQGLFRIQGAPVGTLYLIIDGSTADRPGPWPDLEFVLTTVPGRDNTVNMPIYLVPIDQASGALVDETRGAKITLPEIPGFSLDIAPGSVTFPGGSRSGVVSVTAVHGDKVPMVPNFGQQPRFIVTIQPAGARFNPPARMTLPNLEGLAPGAVTEMYSFDHDLGHFVSIGPATVSEDGSVIAANPGVGVLKAGWHCGGNPALTGTPHDCPECQKCSGSGCVDDNFKGCNDGDGCTVDDVCLGGTCKGTVASLDDVQGSCVGAPGDLLSFAATSRSANCVKWTASGGEPATGSGSSFTTTFASVGGYSVAADLLGELRIEPVTIAPHCSSIQPALFNPIVPMPPDASDFGSTRHGVSRAVLTTFCSEAAKWCFRLKSYTVATGFGFDLRGKLNVESATDTVVTPSTCAAILHDLTPDPRLASEETGDVPRAPYDIYISSLAVERHEREHVADFYRLVLEPIFADLRSFVADPAKCTNCKSPTPEAIVRAEEDRLWDSRLQSYEGAAVEGPAYGAENAVLFQITTAIRQRARTAPASESWPTECR